MKNKGLAELGEFGLIELIRRQADSSAAFRVGIGDDCSVQAIDENLELLTSTDLLIEGVHFNLSWTDFSQLGRKCVAVNISDIAAMGGTPRSLYLGVGVPRNLTIEDLELFIQGFLSAAGEYGAVLAGGDTCGSPGPLMISVTVQGEVKRGRGVTRSGGCSGDQIYVSGTLGDSALVLSQLQGGLQPDPSLAVRHHTPQARVNLGQRLADAGLAKAMIDVSDGLVADLGHILEESGRGAVVTLAHLPLSEGFREILQEQPQRIDLALSGGEDYELLFTAAPEHAAEIGRLAGELNLPLTCIGELIDEPGLHVVREDGSLIPYRQGGFDHFSK